MAEIISYYWLFFIYIVLFLFTLFQGGLWLIYPTPFYNFLKKCCESVEKPMIFVWTNYALFGLGVVNMTAGFFLRSMFDVAFNILLITLSYKYAKYLKEWEYLRGIIPDAQKHLERFFRLVGLFMLVITFLLYLLIKQLMELP